MILNQEIFNSTHTVLIQVYQPFTSSNKDLISHIRKYVTRIQAIIYSTSSAYQHLGVGGGVIWTPFVFPSQIHRLAWPYLVQIKVEKILNCGNWVCLV